MLFLQQKSLEDKEKQLKKTQAEVEALRSYVDREIMAIWNNRSNEMEQLQRGIGDFECSRETELGVSPLVREIVSQAIRRYDADKTEKADFAQESSG